MTQTVINIDTSKTNTGCVKQMKAYFKLVTSKFLIAMVFLNLPFLSLAQEHTSITPVIQTLSLIHI